MIFFFYIYVECLESWTLDSMLLQVKIIVLSVNITWISILKSPQCNIPKRWSWPIKKKVLHVFGQKTQIQLLNTF